MLILKSPAFKDGEKIPEEFSQEGRNISPPLQWFGAGPSVKEFALLCEDPDASHDAPYIHWLIYGISPSVQKLEKAVPNEAVLKSPLGAKQGKNSKGQVGYLGPMPPRGDDPHRYYFRLFALDEELGLRPELTKDEFFDLIRTHIISEAELVGHYQREAGRTSEAPEPREEAAP